MLVAVAIGSTLMAALVISAMCCTCPDPEQPSPEQTQRAALAALAAAVPRPPPSSTGHPVAELPCFPYAAVQGGRVCAICLEALRPGELCSEVPACGHVFHGNCVAAWARSKGSCPLCRAEIVPGSARVAVADDMV
ncbi:hypothetical protein EJB05_45373, partial [Eragrostis curvula]